MNSRQLQYDVNTLLEKESISEIVIKGDMTYKGLNKPYKMVMDSEGYYFELEGLKGLYQKYDRIENNEELSAVYGRLAEYLTITYGLIGIKFTVKD